MSSSHMVLEIPVPRCAQAVAGMPPVFPPRKAHCLAIELIAAFGKKPNKPEPEIKYECQLAHGLSDIIIILQWPYVKSYKTSFENIVNSSNTRQGVDELIRFCTKGARSIYTITVLNAFAMQPDAGNHDPDEACHELLGQILQIEKPRVILQCQRDRYKDAWMGRFDFGASDYNLNSYKVELDKHHTIFAFQSFDL